MAPCAPAQALTPVPSRSLVLAAIDATTRWANQGGPMAVVACRTKAGPRHGQPMPAGEAERLAGWMNANWAGEGHRVVASRDLLAEQACAREGGACRCGVVAM